MQTGYYPRISSFSCISQYYTHVNRNKKCRLDITLAFLAFPAFLNISYIKKEIRNADEYYCRISSFSSISQYYTHVSRNKKCRQDITLAFPAFPAFLRKAGNADLRFFAFPAFLKF